MRHALPLFFLASSLVAATPIAPAENWTLPLFTKEGHHSMTLNGTRVRPVGSDRIDVNDLYIRVYTGDAQDSIRTILISPNASFYPKEDRAAGPDKVRVIEDDAEITGEDWTFQRAGEKVSIHRNVHVTFKESLGDMLR